MTGLPQCMLERPRRAEDPPERPARMTWRPDRGKMAADPLSDVLHGTRLTGAVFRLRQGGGGADRAEIICGFPRADRVAGERRNGGRTTGTGVFT